jgi:hypothetical protein
MARRGVQIIIETPGLRAMAEALLSFEDDVDAGARPELQALGPAIATGVGDAIHAGLNLEGKSLKTLSANTVARRRAKSGHLVDYKDIAEEDARRIARQKDRRPLIETGLLSDASTWRFAIRRDSRGLLSLTARPAKERDKVFYYVAKKGFTGVYGIAPAVILKFEESAAKIMSGALEKWGKKVEAARAR